MTEYRLTGARHIRSREGMRTFRAPRPPDCVRCSVPYRTYEMGSHFLSPQKRSLEESRAESRVKIDPAHCSCTTSQHQPQKQKAMVFGVESHRESTGRGGALQYCRAHRNIFVFRLHCGSTGKAAALSSYIDSFVIMLSYATIY